MFLIHLRVPMQIPMATDDVGVLQRLASQLFGHFHIGSVVVKLINNLDWPQLFFIMLSYVQTRIYHVKGGVFS